MASQAQIDANRRNARKSTGPKSNAGKEQARLNALKHGATARSLIIPGEDAEVLGRRLDDWIDELKPTTQIEAYFVEHAVTISWQLDRANRAQAAILSAKSRDALDQQEHDQAADAEALGDRLFLDPRGPIALYPHYGYSTEVRISVCDDEDRPARLVHRLESTAAGCHWLLARWDDLRSIVESRRVLIPPDKLKAIRLLGKQPLDVLDHADVAMIFLASHVLDPGGRDTPYDELNCELAPGEFDRVVERLEARRYGERMPRDEAEARARLLGLILRETSRLESLATNRRHRAVADWEETPDRLAFDGDAVGERLRRYQVAGNRALVRTVQALGKLRTEIDAANERGTDTFGSIDPSEGSCGTTPVGCPVSSESPPRETSVLTEHPATERNPSTDIIADVAEIADAPSPVPIGAPVESSSTTAGEPVAHPAEAVAEPSSQPDDRAEEAILRNEPNLVSASDPMSMIETAASQGTAWLEESLRRPVGLTPTPPCPLLGDGSEWG